MAKKEFEDELTQEQKDRVEQKVEKIFQSLINSKKKMKKIALSMSAFMRLKKEEMKALLEYHQRIKYLERIYVFETLWDNAIFYDKVSHRKLSRKFVRLRLKDGLKHTMFVVLNSEDMISIYDKAIKGLKNDE